MFETHLWAAAGDEEEVWIIGTLILIMTKHANLVEHRWNVHVHKHFAGLESNIFKEYFIRLIIEGWRAVLVQVLKRNELFRKGYMAYLVYSFTVYKILSTCFLIFT